MRHELAIQHGPDDERVAAGPAYRLLTASVVPRPIAWVSSRSVDGVDNLAPHSFFTVASTDPAMLSFTSVGRKDTLRNIEATGEFVVNVTPEPLFEVVNATSTDYPAGGGRVRRRGGRAGALAHRGPTAGGALAHRVRVPAARGPADR